MSIAEKLSAIYDIKKDLSSLIINAEEEQTSKFAEYPAVLEKVIDENWQGNIITTKSSGKTYVKKNEITSDVYNYKTGTARDTDLLAVMKLSPKIKKIGNDCFRSCASLSAIDFGSVESIGTYAFFSTEKLNIPINLPDTVLSIDERAFQNSKITELNIPSSLVLFNKAPIIENCTNLTSLTVDPANQTYYAESDCLISKKDNALITGVRNKNITIPANVISIADSAFFSSTMSEVYIPSSVKKIGSNTFGSCNSLTSIVVDPANTTLDSRDNCNGIVRTADNAYICGCVNSTIPNGVAKIDARAFANVAITELELPSTVTTIVQNAFYSAQKLSSLTIPSSVTNIQYGAFTTCNSLSATFIDRDEADIRAMSGFGKWFNDTTAKTRTYRWRKNGTSGSFEYSEK